MHRKILYNNSSKIQGLEFCFSFFRLLNKFHYQVTIAVCPIYLAPLRINFVCFF